MAEQKENSSKGMNPIAVVGLVIFGLFIFLMILGSSSNSQNQTDKDLNAKVQHNSEGVYITNQEGSDWTDCMFGINNDGVDSHPPYQTRSDLTIKAGERKFIPFNLITQADGTQFDSNTHTMNTTELFCFQSSGLKVWLGH